VLGYALLEEEIEFSGIYTVGSSNSNLSLPEMSDVDVVILAKPASEDGASQLDILHIIAKNLPKNQFTVIEVVGTARVPLIRMIDNLTGKKVTVLNNLIFTINFFKYTSFSGRCMC